MTMAKVRVDVLAASRGLFPSREAARRAIMAGLVTCNGVRVDKPGTMVAEDAVLTTERAEHSYVGRGGLKLERALRRFDVRLDGKVVVDVGASTGGFTDCALQNGASLVYAVDVGYGQLAWRLRTDPRVRVMEKTNFRYVDPESFSPRPEVGVMDVSFISTRLLLPKLTEILTPGGDIISLVKPQFEAGRDKVGKGGIVRDPCTHLAVLRDLVRWIYDHGLSCRGLDYSPITGGDGNLEYLAWWHMDLESSLTDSSIWLAKANEVVTLAWSELRGEQVDLSACE
ncbi:MAG: TlyA family RNA methyltransferase [Alicyclobacillus herbarius]|uniref:TlyA family RNA methyltransferase n=1 Tax=Alicyclobacillus herbarius TaxID=122960 RepID=UPI00047AEDE9|nr:TlyA family RNA methyltransferase [Alicyclobacillus herbarius]MCL6633629.1 TlyA family RNA methyltransferase [Alicyclobacillus herbarius]